MLETTEILSSDTAQRSQPYESQPPTTAAEKSSSSIAIPPSNPADPFAYFPPYQPPTAGLVSLLPAWAVPYAELARLHKPAGYYAFLFPHLFGTLLAAATVTSPSGDPPSVSAVLCTAALHLASCLFLRGAACSYNDALDGPYDRRVERCRHRPVARGAVSPLAAHGFAAALAILWVALLAAVEVPRATWDAVVQLALTMAVYPFCKRVTNFPQVVLGFSLALGQNVGFASMNGVEPTTMAGLVGGGGSVGSSGRMMKVGRGALYLSNVLNAMVYDTVYAHQDLRDDLKAHVMSMAIACLGWTKEWLSLLSAIEVGLLSVTGWAVGFQGLYWPLAVGGTATVLAYMLREWKVEESADCWKWFCWTIWLTGGTLCAGLAGEYVNRL